MSRVRHPRGCGWVYSVTLPGGKHRVLGACSGSFDADAAPTVPMSPGQLLQLRVATSLGKPVVGLPTVSSGALTVTRATRTTLTLLATGPGRSVLTAHTNICSRPGHGSLRSCPVLRVAVSWPPASPAGTTTGTTTERRRTTSGRLVPRAATVTPPPPG